eukprot:303099-Pleurochrysis_carterae.AAC.8
MAESYILFFSPDASRHLHIFERGHDWRSLRSAYASRRRPSFLVSCMQLACVSVLKNVNTIQCALSVLGECISHSKTRGEASVNARLR